MMNVDEFKLVLREMEYGNVNLQYGETNMSGFNVTFNTVIQYEDAVEFCFNPDKLAEQTPSAIFDFSDILHIKRFSPECGALDLYGDNGLQIAMKNNCTIDIVFDVKDEKVLGGDFCEIDVKENIHINSVQEFFNTVLSHKGGFQVNVNSLDVPEIEQIGGLGIEFHDLYFRDVKSLVEDELISFGNDSIKATSISEDGIPCFPMELNSGLYLKKSMIDYVEKLDKDKFADMFEMGISSAIYNIYLLGTDPSGKRNVVTIGFID